MHTLSTSRRAAAANGTGRFSRSQPTRIALRGPARTTSGRLARTKGRKQQSGGLTGALSSALSTLPSTAQAKSKIRGGSKTKPALALAAAGAGAVLGRRQMQKRNEPDTSQTTAIEPMPEPAAAPPIPGASGTTGGTPGASGTTGGTPGAPGTTGGTPGNTGLS